MRKRQLWVGAGTASIVAAAWSAARADVPAQLTEQGRLFDTSSDASAGTPVNGATNFVFTIYDAAAAGTPLWTEKQTIALDSGFFSAVLGESTPIPPATLVSAAQGGKTLYLGITVNDDAELSPRQPLLSVPYALVAGNAIGAITPTSVSVGGKEVINDAGVWVGPTAGLQGPAGATGATWPLRGTRRSDRADGTGGRERHQRDERRDGTDGPNGSGGTERRTTGPHGSARAGGTERWTDWTHRAGGTGRRDDVGGVSSAGAGSAAHGGDRQLLLAGELIQCRRGDELHGDLDRKRLHDGNAPGERVLHGRRRDAGSHGSAGLFDGRALAQPELRELPERLLVQRGDDGVHVQRDAKQRLQLWVQVRHADTHPWRRCCGCVLPGRGGLFLNSPSSRTDASDHAGHTRQMTWIARAAEGGLRDPNGARGGRVARRGFRPARRALLPLLLLASCGTDDTEVLPPTDGGPATACDAVCIDAGTGSTDSGAADGPALDGGGVVDASTSDSPDDGSPEETDASDTDASGLLSCPELATTNPWQDLTGAHTLADRGAILACAHVATLTAAQVAASAYFEPQIGAATNGYDLFVVQYVSEGTPGVARAVTALFYLPSGAATDLPIAAVDHPTSGLGPACGPTHDSAITDNIALPLAGRGYAVVATDYAGMGVDNGMTSYLIGDIEAANTLDATRALLRFHDAHFDAARLGTDFFVLGHSQGGHAALFTHAAFDSSIGIGLRLRGSVSFAPGWGDMRLIQSAFDSASAPDDPAATFTLMALYTEMTANAGPDAGTWLTPSAASALPAWLHDQCDPGLIATVEDRFAQQGDLYPQAFMQSAAACAFPAPCPSFEPWSSELLAQEPGDFTSTAPALLMQGESDTLVLPESTACLAARLEAQGTPVEACGYAGDTHTTIVGSALPDAFVWMTELRNEEVIDPCPTPLTTPCP